MSLVKDFALIWMPVKEYCRWTDAMKLRLVKLTHKYKGYIKTDDNFKEKWTIICEKLLIDYPDLIIKPAALQNQFWRFSERSWHLRRRS